VPSAQQNGPFAETQYLAFGQQAPPTQVVPSAQQISAFAEVTQTRSRLQHFPSEVQMVFSGQQIVPAAVVQVRIDGQHRPLMQDAPVSQQTATPSWTQAGNVAPAAPLQMHCPFTQVDPAGQQSPPQVALPSGQTQTPELQTVPRGQQNGVVPAGPWQAEPFSGQTQAPSLQTKPVEQQTGAAAVPQDISFGQHAPPIQRAPSGQQTVPFRVWHVARFRGQTHAPPLQTRPAGQQIGAAAVPQTASLRQHAPFRQTVSSGQQIGAAPAVVWQTRADGQHVVPTQAVPRGQQIELPFASLQAARPGGQAQTPFWQVCPSGQQTGAAAVPQTASARQHTPLMHVEPRPQHTAAAPVPQKARPSEQTQAPFEHTWSSGQQIGAAVVPQTAAFRQQAPLTQVDPRGQHTVAAPVPQKARPSAQTQAPFWQACPSGQQK